MGRKQQVSEGTTQSIQEPLATPRAAKRSRKGVELTPAEFWRLVQEYPKGAGTEFALYRKWPVIDRRLSGETKTSIDIQKELDPEYILKHWGTGRYTVYFNDHNTRPSCICNAVFDLELDWDRPPVLNQVELIEGHPDNKGFIEQLKIRGLWKREKEQDEMAEGGMATAFQEMAGLAKAAIEEKNKPKTAEVAERSAIEIMGTAYKEAAKTIAESRPAAPGSGSDRVMDLILKRMDQQHELMLKVLDERRAPAQQTASLDSQLGVVTKVLEFAGRVNAPAPASWLDRLPDFLPMLAPFLARLAAPPAPPMAPVYAGPATLGPVPVTAAPPAAAPEFDQAAIEAMAQQTGLDAATMTAFLRVGQKAIRAYQDGYSGAAFAELIETTEGDQMYLTLHAVGKDTILSTLRKLPAFMLGPAAPAVQSPQFEAWIDGFMAYGDDSEEEPAAAAGTPEEAA